MNDLIRREDVLDIFSDEGWLGDSLRRIDALPAITVQAQIDAVTLRQTLHDLITEQSEGEWDDKTIAKDVEVFLTAILALLRKGDQP